MDTQKIVPWLCGAVLLTQVMNTLLMVVCLWWQANLSESQERAEKNSAEWAQAIAAEMSNRLRGIQRAYER